jgi:DNA-binding CsgD family transcriptional regulator
VIAQRSDRRPAVTGLSRTLGISAKTLGTHVEHICAKAGVTTGAAAAVFAMELDLLA